MKKTLILLTMTTLSGCMSLGAVEKEALKDRAIQDARVSGSEVHLAYLQCYAMRDLDKKDCKRRVKGTIEGRKDASTWEYILPFDYEAERMGFAQFLRDAGKTCASVDQGPRFNKESNAYDVICTDGNQYNMQFNYEQSKWGLVK